MNPSYRHVRLGLASCIAMLLLSCLALPVLAQAPPKKEDGSPLLKQAYDLSQKAEDEAGYNKVLELCQQGLATGVPAESVKYARDLMSWAHNRRGQVRLEANDLQAALNEFEQALKLDPTRWRALHNRGYCRAATGDLKGALEDFDRTIALNPKYSKAYFNRAEIYCADNKLELAVRDYSEALRVNPSDAEAYNLRGHAYYRLRDFGRAQNDYNQSLRIDPKNVQALVNRGDFYGDFGKYAEAARDYQSALNNDPENHRAYLSAAWMMATCPDNKFRNADLALQAANKAVELLGDGPSAFRHRYLEALAAAHANAGQFEQAVKVQTEARDNAPVNEQVKFAERIKLYQSGQPYRDARANPQANPQANATSQR